MFTALLVPAPDEVFIRGVTTGQVKEGEKVLFSRGCHRRGDAWLLLLQLPTFSLVYPEKFPSSGKLLH